jgi:ribosomal protein S18 acetylase RimI-like enzyme
VGGTQLKLTYYISRVVKTIKEGGVLLLLKRVAGYCAESNCAGWYERDLTLPITDVSPEVPLLIDFDNFEKALDWFKSSDVRRWMHNAGEIAVSLRCGHRYPLVINNGTIVGCIKIGFHDFFITDYTKAVHFSEKVAYHTDVYVEPEYRKKGIARFLIVESMKHLKQKGFVKQLCHIPPWNQASIAVHTALGFEKVGYIRCVRVFGLKLLFRRGKKIFRSGILTLSL